MTTIIVRDQQNRGNSGGSNLVQTYDASTIDSLIAAGGGGSPDTLQVVSSTGSSYTIDTNTANYWDITLTSNTVTLSFTPKNSGNLSTFTLVVRQDGTGSRQISWPGSVDWAGGLVPTLSTGANDVDIFSFLSTDGGTTWFGVLSGNDFQ